MRAPFGLIAIGLGLMLGACAASDASLFGDGVEAFAERHRPLFATCAFAHRSEAHATTDRWSACADGIVLVRRRYAPPFPGHDAAVRWATLSLRQGGLKARIASRPPQEWSGDRLTWSAVDLFAADGRQTRAQVVLTSARSRDVLACDFPLVAGATTDALVARARRCMRALRAVHSVLAADGS